jgi:hypothetical protein
MNPPDLATWPEPPPPICALDRFPSSATCERQIAFLAARRAWLGNLHDLYKQPQYAEWFSDALIDVGRREEPWEALRGAHAWMHDCGMSCEIWDGFRWHTEDAPSPAKVRERLTELRRLLGPRDFENGTMLGLIDPAFWRRAD